jgi:hypothetical protein
LAVYGYVNLCARSKLLVAVIASLALSVTLVACSSGTTGSGSGSGSELAGWQSSHNGVTATIPAGWHRVPLVDLPGAEVPLQIASAAVHGGVLSKICGYPRALMSQIPSGGALLQILQDSGVKRRGSGAVSQVSDLSQIPPLTRPFHLGEPQGHECGEAYNIFFRKGGRAFQLRVWSALAGLSPKVRTQIERLMDGLRVDAKSGS